MGSSLIMSTLNSTRDIPLTDKEIDELHKIVAYKNDDDHDIRASLTSPSSGSTSATKKSSGSAIATGNHGNADANALEDISLIEMFVWSAMNLWGVWLLTCVLTMWALREHLPIRESLNQYMLAMHLVTLEDQVVLCAMLAIILFFTMCLDIYCQRVYATSIFAYIKSGDFLSLKLPEKREAANVLSDYKVWRNPLCMFRGSEYARYTWATTKQPLTNWDRELTAQDHSVMFVCSSDSDNPDSADALMADAWRSSCSAQRLQLAHKALERDPGHPAALLMLAEEEATTIVETESFLRQALKNLETSGREINPGPVVIVGSTQTNASRNKTLLIYTKWRLGMCARKLGHLKEAVRLFRQITRDCPYLSAHENLIEALLEMKNYADVQQVLSKYDDLGLPKSASICYTAVLLRARSAGELPLAFADLNRGGVTNVELELVASISRAVEFNPHVPQYLLEQKSYVFPPEHVVKRGDSEAVAYAYHHLQHWKHVESALIVLHYSWENAIAHLTHPTQQGRYFHPYPTSTRDGDYQILPAHHSISAHPFERTPSSIKVTFSACMVSLAMTLLLQTFPIAIKGVWALVLQWLHVPLEFSSRMLELYCPVVFQTLSDG